MKYIVKTGDTLYKIALTYGITLDELIAANPQIPDPDVIQIGQEINIPVAEMPGGIPMPLPTPYPPEYPIEQPPYIPCPGGMMPDMGGMMPDMGGMMPDMGGIMPGMGGMMPDMGGMMPDMGGMMPDMGGMMPDMGGMMPDMGGMMPDMGGMMPDMGGMMPGMGGMMPGMGGMMPKMGGMMPDMGGMMPNYECDDFFAIQPGDKGSHVRCVQERLKNLGYYHGACNGRFGSKTKSAVKKYQSDCGMERTGVVDLLMLTALGLF